MCLLDDDADDVADAPLNQIGVFEVKNVILDVVPSTAPSTRTHALLHTNHGPARRSAP